MKAKLAILVVLVVGIFLFGCTSNTNGYAGYNQQQQQGQPQQQQYVGGGCGVAPEEPYGVVEVPPQSAV